MHDHLVPDADARVVAMVPLRDNTTRSLLATFQHGLAEGSLPLACLEEHILTGQDDWDGDEETQEVECWWGIFGREVSDRANKTDHSLDRN